MRILAFGGPLNEQMVTVPDDRHVWLAPVPERVSSYLNDPGPVTPSLRTVTYRVETVAYHDNTRCTPFHENGCRWDARCLVADGYPKRRITDALNAIASLASLARGVR